MSAHRRPEIRFTDAPRGTCRWCGEAIVHEDGPRAGEPNLRRRWHPECVATYEESDPRIARQRVRRRDRGVCAECGVDTIALRRKLRGRGMAKALRERGFLPRRSLWELDHIVPLIDGGGHTLDNLQTLCMPCHKAKTAAEARARALAREATVADQPSKTLATGAEPKPDREPQQPPRKASRSRRRRDRKASLGDLLAKASQLNDQVEATLRALARRD